MKKLIASALLAAATLASAPAYSATISVSTDTLAGTNETGRDEQSQFFTGDSAEAPSLSASTQAVSGGTNGLSTAFADSDTGVLRAISSMNGNSGDGVGFGNSSASASIVETYLLSGSGTLTASILLDGVWSLTRATIQPGPPPLPFWQAQAQVSIGPNTQFVPTDFACFGTACGPSLSTASEGSVDGLLLQVTRDFFLTSPTNVNVDFSLFTQLLTGDGFVNFGNTAKLFVEASDGLTATPSDPDFLSDPAFLQVIPVPPALPLMLAGLAALAMIGRAKRRA